MNNEVTNQDIMDMLNVLIDRTNNIGSLEKKLNKMATDNNKDLGEIKSKLKKLELDNENEIKPNLQLVLENQTKVINQKAHITEVETKVDAGKDGVDVLKIVAQEHSRDIEQLKKRA